MMFSSSSNLPQTPPNERTRQVVNVRFQITKSGCYHLLAVSDRLTRGRNGRGLWGRSPPLGFLKSEGFLMWAKGTPLGLWLVGFGTIAWLYFSIFRRLPPGPGEVGVTVFMAYTIQNPVWWAGVLVCLVLAFVIVRS